MQTIKQLDELEYLDISNTQGRIKIALQGAHIFDFKIKDKKPLLFLSETARFEKKVPIRGGVPICWPWFGPHKTDTSLPNHGFARISLWEHLATQELSENKTKISLGLKSSKETLTLWPYEFELILEIVMSDILELHLITKNTGNKDIILSQALHTYLNIDDIHTAQLKGLDKKYFYNKVNDSHDNLQEGPLVFNKEVDRVYYGVEDVLKIERITVQTLKSQTVVVWNPGKTLVEKMPDLSSYEKMLCIESASGLQGETVLKVGETHTLTSIISQV